MYDEGFDNWPEQDYQPGDVDVQPGDEQEWLACADTRSPAEQARDDAEQLYDRAREECRSWDEQDMLAAVSGRG